MVSSQYTSARVNHNSVVSLRGAGVKITDSWGLMKTAERQFTTISGVPIEPVYGPDDLRGRGPGARNRRTRRVPLHARHPSRHVSRQALDHAAVLRLRHAGGDQPPLPLPAGAGADRTLRGLRPADPDGLRRRSRAERRRSGQVRRAGLLAGGHGDSLPRHSAGRCHRLHDHQLAGVGAVGHVPGGGGAAGRGLDAALRHAAERHPEGIHRAEGVHLPAAPFHAAGDRYHRVRRAPHAALQPDFDQRLSHSRGRLDGGAGTGIHAARRHRVRRLGARARPGDRRIRAAAQLLLQRAQRFLRGDRQVPGGAQDLGARHARALRRDRANAA